MANTELEDQAQDLMTKLCLESSLYQRTDLGKDAHNVITRLRRQPFQMDVHCVGCGREVVFKKEKVYGGETGVDAIKLNHAPIQVDFYCQRGGHRYSYFLLKDGNGIIKVGQFPSTEDIASADIDKYRRVLDKEQFANLRRAGGLNAHGIGIGAFVYLRRIFEKLIQQHREELEHESAPIEGWDEMRMADRIKALKSVLPPALVEHRQAYSILSQGVHELDEATCLKHFPVVRAAIILMLEQDLQELEKRKAEDQLRSEMSAIMHELGAPSTAMPEASGEPSETAAK